MKKSEYSLELVIDPVCSMEVVPKKDLLFNYRLNNYYFCCEDCLEIFAVDPEHYLEPNYPRRRGWWGSSLERLIKANEGRPLNRH